MKKFTIYQMTACAVMAALMCILGPFSVPIGPVPISVTNLVIYVTVMILSTKLSLTSYIIYLLLGIVGLPVFSGFQGGLSKIAGPTGGYLIGFILMIVICGIFVKKFREKPVFIGIGMFIATLVAYAFGTVWFVIMMQCSLLYALTVCVFPFIPFDIAKIVIAIIVGSAIYRAMKKAGLVKYE